MEKPEPKKIVAHKYKVFGNDKDFQKLDSMAKSVNTVWAYCNDASDYFFQNRIKNAYKLSDTEQDKSKKNKAKKEGKKYKLYPTDMAIEQKVLFFNPFVGGYNPNQPQTVRVNNGRIEHDLDKLTAGASKMLGITSATISAVRIKYCLSRKNKSKIVGYYGIKCETNKRFIANRNRKNKPWIPMKDGFSLDHSTGILKYNKESFKINIDRPIIGKILIGEFVKEVDGWFVILVQDVGDYKCLRSHNDDFGTGVLGIDLGLKTFATLSDGEKIDFPDPQIVKVWGRTGEITQTIDNLRSLKDRIKNRWKKKRKENKELRLGKKFLLIEKKILQLEGKKRRYIEHFHYNTIIKILKKADIVIIGDISSEFLKSSHGKKASCYAFGLFKSRFEWEARKLGKTLIIKDERNTTIMCNNCKELTGPKGFEGLKIRDWKCSKCGHEHDRDVNAALNIRDLYNPLELSGVVEVAS